MSAGSFDWDSTRGVALSVPHVISCFIPVGPSSDGVGDGIEGTNECKSSVNDFGRSAKFPSVHSIAVRERDLNSYIVYLELLRLSCYVWD